ncbi:MAG: hypothetical protein V2A55_00180 [Candidatus Jorgensenbacteria bacterium]
MKLIFKILIIILVLAVLGLAIYLIFGGNDEVGEAPEPGTEEEPTEAATPEESALKKISDNPVFDFWVNKSTKEIFYLTLDGKVVGAKNGPDLEISEQTIDALNFIEIGPGGKRVLAAFGDPQTPQWGIFDVVDGVWRPLPADIMKAVWGGSDEKLIVTVKSGNDLNLSEADITKTPPSYKVIIRDFRLKDVKMTYLPENRIIISEPPSASYAASLWQLDLKSLALSTLVAPEEGLYVSWSDDKKSAFFSGSDSGFSVLDENLRIEIPRPFDTLPGKCAADSSKIYCFVPQSLPAGVSLPDDYLTKKFFSIDDLLVLEIDNYDEVEKILTSNSAGVSAIDAKNPRISGDKLYFINRYDNNLYELAL